MSSSFSAFSTDDDDDFTPADEFEPIMMVTKAVSSRNQQPFDEDTAKVVELEQELQQGTSSATTTNVVTNQYSKLQNDLKEFMERIKKMDNDEKRINDQLMAISEQIDEWGKKKQMQKDEKEKQKADHVLETKWDVSKCHDDLTIGDNNSIGHDKKNLKSWSRSVFTKESIQQSTVTFFSEIFYFEISVNNKNGDIIFGIAVKHQAPLDKSIYERNGTYAYVSDGYFLMNGSGKSGDESFGNGDTVGFGVILTNMRMFTTKNGQRILGYTNLLSVSSSHSANELFPFVSLCKSGDKIEANFGPIFTFDLATL